MDSTMEALRRLDEVEIVNPVFMPEPGHPVYATNQFLVEPYPWVAEAMIDSLNEIYHVEIINDNPVLQIGYVLGITAETPMDVVVAAQRYYESGFFLCAEANLLSRPFDALTPDDPIFADQWYLRNDGENEGIPGADIAISRAWDITMGDDDVVIAIIDNGFGLAHEDLSGTTVCAPMNAAGHYVEDGLPTTDTSPWCVGYDPPYYLSCIHGTVVSGVPFARTNNGIGIAGIAPNCRLMPIRDTDDWGYTDIATLERAFYHTYQGPYRADIISCSWYWYSSAKLELALQRAYESGRLIFFSSGNSGYMTFPSYTQWVISVGATDRRDSITYFSGRGDSLDLVAPGDDMPTIDFTGEPGYNPLTDTCTGDQSYACHLSGTSLSCPQAAAVAALVLSRRVDWKGNKSISVRDSLIKVLINSSEDQINPGDPAGWDATYGHGRINAYRALLSVIRGDVNNDGAINPVDVVILVNYVYKDQGSLQPEECVGDCDCTGSINPVDVVYLVNWVYKSNEGYPPPVVCFDYMGLDD